PSRSTDGTRADPACGGGRTLPAAAHRLVTRGCTAAYSVDLCLMAGPASVAGLGKLSPCALTRVRPKQQACPTPGGQRSAHGGVDLESPGLPAPGRRGRWSCPLTDPADLVADADPMIAAQDAGPTRS